VTTAAIKTLRKRLRQALRRGIARVTAGSSGAPGGDRGTENDDEKDQGEGGGALAHKLIRTWSLASGGVSNQVHAPASTAAIVTSSGALMMCSPQTRLKHSLANTNY
jgi:hypothetical protein